MPKPDSQARSAAMRSDDPRHGTENGYNNLGCRCSLCRAAHAAFHRERRSRGIKVMTHGTRGGYCNGCRCDDCRAAHTTYARELRRTSQEILLREYQAEIGRLHDAYERVRPEVKPR